MFKKVILFFAVLLFIFSFLRMSGINLVGNAENSAKSSEKNLRYWQKDPYAAEYAILFNDLKKRGYQEYELEDIFSDSRVRFYSHIYYRESEPGEVGEKKKIKKQTCLDYHLGKREVRRGKNFLLAHRDLLQRIENTFGVDKEAVVSILKVETNFGRHFGGYSIFGVYNTAFSMHWREETKKWARQELISFLVICKKNGWDPFSIKGSNWGAFGWPQFLPTSYQHFAVDGNNDGKINLFDLEDGAYSVANYLKQHGWKMGDSTVNRKAIYAYNRDWYYVEIVEKYTEKIKEKDS